MEKKTLEIVQGEESSSRQLTIAHFMPWSGIGGTEIATLRMMSLTKDRFRNILFCLPDAAAFRNLCETAGIETVIYTPPEPSLRHAATFYRQSRQVADQILQVGADIVHFSDLKAVYHNSLASLLAHTHRISHFRVTYTQLTLRQKFSLLPIQSFVFVSQEARKSFPMSLDDDRARVVYDSIEVSGKGEKQTSSSDDVRREFALPPGCTLIGMVARVSPQKDYITLAYAAADVLRKHPNVRFLIIGDNSEIDVNRHHYQQVLIKLNELQIADKFIFTGERKDVPQLLDAMDIFVLCTHREGFPLSILEAMAMRKPVVASAVGGIPEIVISGVTGYLHQHEDATQLAEAINQLIELPETRNRIASAGYEHVRQNHSREKFIHDISLAYSDLMRR